MCVCVCVCVCSFKINFLGNIDCTHYLFQIISHNSCLNLYMLQII